jgi:N-methylhydantoinase A
MSLLGVDIGGTFTDIVVVDDDGRATFGKVLTTPDDPATAFLAGALDTLERAAVAPRSVERVAHATTLATNVILERRGATVAFLTTRGFRNLLTLGRATRMGDARFDLFFDADEAPVPDALCFEVPERIGPGGQVVEPLDEGAAVVVCDRIAELAPDAVAVCLLHAYANPDHERRVGELLAERGLAAVLSHDVWPELREHDRAATTLMSAYVGPVMAGYLDDLQRRLHDVGIDAPVHVMDSAGGVMSTHLAASRAVRTIESGPAAGVMAAARHGDDVLSFDMGGTTAKAAVVRHGRPDLSYDFRVGGGASGHHGGLLVKVPSIDLVEVGSGGGSLAWVDPGGRLRVGPRSAGAVPGPACYGRGGDRPTVTDADLVLGYLDAELAGGVTLDRAAAEQALQQHVADPLGTSVVEAAAAVHDLAVAQMGDAVHIVTVQRGIDPRRFTLVALGGAGPVHAARIAERFQIDRVIVPIGVGVASAIGLLTTDLTTERSQAVVGELDFAGLEAACRDDLGASTDGPGEIERFVDARYRGQAHDLTVPADGWEEGFRRRYAERYGSATERPVELVAARVRMRIPVAKADLRIDAGPATTTTRPAWFPELGGFVETEVHHGRADARGPAILQDREATTVVPPGWTATNDRDLVLTRG